MKLDLDPRRYCSGGDDLRRAYKLPTPIPIDGPGWLTLPRVPEKMSKTPDESFDPFSLLDRELVEKQFGSEYTYYVPAEPGRCPAGWMRTEWGDRMWWRGHRHSLSTDQFKNFSVEQLAMVMNSSAIEVSFHRVFRHDSYTPIERWHEHPHTYLWSKVENSIWRYGWKRDWNETADAYDALKRLSFLIPGFKVSLAHTCGSATKGHAFQGYDYLDGVFGLLVDKIDPEGPDKRVLTIGFSIAGDRRVLLQQVQLSEKKGNRWLFKLQKPLLEHAVDVLRNAFEPFNYKIYVIDGWTAAQRVKESYGKSGGPGESELNRIASIYDAELKGYRRSKTFAAQYESHGHLYYPLEER